MRVVIQRVSKASIEVNKKTIGKIHRGLVIFLGVGKDDEESDAEYLVNKIVELRIFEDEQDKMNLSLKEIGGELLTISQFTLYANTRKGRRPSFIEAAIPEKAQSLYEYFIQLLKHKNFSVKTGIFGAMMQIKIYNQGPVTIIIDSKDRFKGRRDFK